MQASRANFRSFLTGVDETAVTALPYHFAFLSEYAGSLYILDESEITFFVSFFGNGDVAVHKSNFGKPSSSAISAN